MSVRTIARRSPINATRAAIDRVTARLRSVRDDGMTTAEYAIGTLAAVAFAAALIGILESGAVRDLVQGVIELALNRRN